MTNDGLIKMISRFFSAAVLLLVSLSVWAGSYPASSTYINGQCPGTGVANPDPAIVCKQANSNAVFIAPSTCSAPGWGTCQIAINYTCPNGGALSGSTCIKTCTAPKELAANGLCVDPCPAGTSRKSDGTCTTTCAAGQTKEVSYFSGKWAVCDKQSAGCLTGTLSVPSTYCDGNCVYSLADSINSAPAVAGATVDKPSPVYVYKNGTNTGQTCTVADNTSAPTPPTIPQKAPPCAAGEGVLTSSSGTVKCVPSATPGNTPTVSTKTKVDTFSDGSKKTTTTTTTTDPVSGATNTSDAVNTTGAGGGTTPGQAGTPGSSSSNADASNTKGTANEPGQKDQKGDCQIEPDAPHCREFKSPGTDGLYQKKEKTMDSVFSTFSSTVKGSSLGSAASGFFNVSSPSGSCPNWSLTVPFLNVQLDGASFFCSGSILAAMDGAGAVLLALATYIAFTWAFL